MSQTIRGLKAGLGIRLSTGAARSVAPTEAGERLLETVGPRLEEIEAEIESFSELRDRPAGTIRQALKYLLSQSNVRRQASSAAARS